MPERKPSLDALAVGLLVLCCTLWGLNQVATKLTLPHIPPLIQAGSRSLMAAALLALWSAWRGIALGPGNGTLRGGLLAGVLFAAEFAAIFIGLQHTTASRMVVFLYSSPFVVALGMPLVVGTPWPSGWQWAGLALAFAGVAAAFAEGWGGGPAGASTALGDGLGLLAALLWGATTLTVRRSRLATAAPEQTLFYQLAISGVLLSAASWAVGEPWPAPASLGAQPLLLMGFQTVVVTAASYLVWFWLVRHYPATQVASFTLLTPLAGLLAGVGLLGEPLTTRLLLACAAVVAGIVLVNRPARAAVSPMRR